MGDDEEFFDDEEVDIIDDGEDEIFDDGEDEVFDDDEDEVFDDDEDAEEFYKSDKAIPLLDDDASDSEVSAYDKISNITNNKKRKT
jgi:hypothetical protein